MGLLADQAISGLVKRDGASRRLTFERINYSPALTPALVATASFKDAPLGLIDVGASGGIEAHWRAFAGALRAWGFDCLVEEVNRLNASTPSPDVVYYAKFVSYKGYQSLFSDSSSADRCVRNNSPFSRTSSVRAQQLMGWNHVSRMYDPVGHGKLTTETIELDDFFERVTDQIDFIKIDTDGHDYPVLLGAERLLREKFILEFVLSLSFTGRFTIMQTFSVTLTGS